MIKGWGIVILRGRERKRTKVWKQFSSNSLHWQLVPLGPCLFSGKTVAFGKSVCQATGRFVHSGLRWKDFLSPPSWCHVREEAVEPELVRPSGSGSKLCPEGKGAEEPRGSVNKPGSPEWAMAGSRVLQVNLCPKRRPHFSSPSPWGWSGSSI